MAAPQVIGASPVSFTSEDSTTSGVQYEIPLSTLKFDSKGAIDPSDWPPIKNKKLPKTDATILGIVLADLLKRGVISSSS